MSFLPRSTYFKYVTLSDWSMVRAVRLRCCLRLAAFLENVILLIVLFNPRAIWVCATTYMLPGHILPVGGRRLLLQLLLCKALRLVHFGWADKSVVDAGPLQFGQIPLTLLVPYGIVARWKLECTTMERMGQPSLSKILNMNGKESNRSVLIDYTLFGII